MVRIHSHLLSLFLPPLLLPLPLPLLLPPLLHFSLFLVVPSLLRSFQSQLPWSRHNFIRSDQHMSASLKLHQPMPLAAVCVSTAQNATYQYAFESICCSLVQTALQLMVAPLRLPACCQAKVYIRSMVSPTICPSFAPNYTLIGYKVSTKILNIHLHACATTINQEHRSHQLPVLHHSLNIPLAPYPPNPSPDARILDA
jgi:hypothetical protein